MGQYGTDQSPHAKRPKSDGSTYNVTPCQKIIQRNHGIRKKIVKDVDKSAERGPDVIVWNNISKEKFSKRLDRQKNQHIDIVGPYG